MTKYLFIFLLAALSAQAQTRAILFTPNEVKQAAIPYDVGKVAIVNQLFFMNGEDMPIHLARPGVWDSLESNTLIAVPDGLGPFYLFVGTEMPPALPSFDTCLYKDILTISKDTTLTFYGRLPYILHTADNEEYEVTITRKSVHIPDTTYYDDRNGAIVYSGTWGGGNHTHLKWFDNTGRWSNQIGAKATLNFIGTGVAVFGEQKMSSHGEVAFVLDGGPRVIWDMGGSDAGMDYHVRHTPSFIATGLTDGPHTLEIIVLENRYGFIDLIQTWR